MASTEDDIPEGDEFANDKEAKKTLLIETIAKESTTSEQPILQQINKAIGEGGTLEAIVLSGGYTNYSYKVYVKEQPELCVFAKLSFEYALWNPDKTAHYDLQRTVNEYDIMVTSNAKTPECVIKPLALIDLKQNNQNMKCLVTEWAKADEQIINQFIDGSVDTRIAPKLASTLASMHLIKDFDPDFNINVKPCMESLLNDTMSPTALKATTVQEPKDRTETYCKELGTELTMKIINASIADYHQKDCLIHSDSHAGNILVEAKPSIDKLEEFGELGAMVLCDWEMSMVGPKGRDIGLALSFPIGCLLAHGLNGQPEANESIELFINSLIDSYLECLKDSGKTEDELAAILRNIIGWSGWFMYLAFHMLGVQMEFFPVETEEKIGRLKDAVGILGLKFLRLSYDTDYLPAASGLDEIRKMFNTLLDEEVVRAQDMWASFRRKKQPRKSSIFRTTNRRVSDTTGMLMHAAESVRNLSLSTVEDGK